MGNIRTALITGCIAVISVYFGTAFVKLELNAFLWSESERLVFCYLSIVLAWLVAGLPYVLFKKK